MDWTLAIDKNCAALAGVVADLIAMVGRAQTGAPSRLRRLAILRILRPAESALRRLIVIVAAMFPQAASPLRGGTRGKRSAADWVGVATKPDEDNSPQRAVENSAYSDPHPDQLRSTRFSDLPSRGRLLGTQPLPDFSAFARRDRVPAFALIDPRKRFGEAGGFTGFARTVPRISVPGVIEPARLAKRDDAIDAEALLRRIGKIDRALKTLPRQARRLLRLMARRAHAEPGPGRVGPIRPGPPPGLASRRRRRYAHPVDDILRDCHFLAQTSGPKPP